MFQSLSLLYAGRDQIPVGDGQRLAGLIVFDGVHFCVELDAIVHGWCEGFGHATEAAFDGVPLFG
jgi:hypothetical protein